MSSNESAAFEIMTELDVDYVLVIFGGVIGYSGDDINKFLWMVRDVDTYVCCVMRIAFSRLDQHDMISRKSILSFVCCVTCVAFIR